mmetsp:Transcript_37704/g.61981  ORF Transcript_37704/g.61981 Transcript_37704/m.61981 type:complete len:263 (-) Transcript_37704:577-1365(-)
MMIVNISFQIFSVHQICNSIFDHIRFDMKSMHELLRDIRNQQRLFIALACLHYSYNGGFQHQPPITKHLLFCFGSFGGGHAMNTRRNAIAFVGWIPCLVHRNTVLHVITFQWRFIQHVIFFTAQWLELFLDDIAIDAQHSCHIHNAYIANLIQDQEHACLQRTHLQHDRLRVEVRQNGDSAQVMDPRQQSLLMQRLKVRLKIIHHFLHGAREQEIVGSVARIVFMETRPKSRRQHFTVKLVRKRFIFLMLGQETREIKLMIA